jgi:hypothetical protein
MLIEEPNGKSTSEHPLAARDAGFSGEPVGGEHQKEVKHCHTKKKGYTG